MRSGSSPVPPFQLNALCFALGGAMGRVADACGIQFRLLNRSRGPAVRGPRAQQDKRLYHETMLAEVVTRENLTLIEGEVASLIVDDMPFMDDAEMRRGRQANHRVFGQDVAGVGAASEGDHRRVLEQQQGVRDLAAPARGDEPLLKPGRLGRLVMLETALMGGMGLLIGALIGGAVELAERSGCSSLHVLFPTEDELPLFREAGLSPEAIRHGWRCVSETALTLIGEPPAVGEAWPPLVDPTSKRRRNHKRMTDDDLMPWGKHADKPLGDVPDDYWQWFLRQDWCDEWPDLVEYANTLIEDD